MKKVDEDGFYGRPSLKRVTMGVIASGVAVGSLFGASNASAATFQAAACAGALNPAQAPTYAAVKTANQGVSLRAAPALGAAKIYGIAENHPFKLLAQVMGQSVTRTNPAGPANATWDYVQVLTGPSAGQIGYIPDTYANTPSQANTLMRNSFGTAIPVCNETSGAVTGASGPGNFANRSIADVALRYVGQRGGQCRDFVNNVVSQVSGNSMQLGATTQAELADYFQSFRRLGAYSVPSVDAILPGDIVQQTSDPNSPALHTYIVVANLGGGRFRVVDSNHSYNEVVQTYDRSYTGGAAFRLGKV
jgi:hypothetical protein